MPDRPAKRVDFIHVSIHRVVAHCCAKCDLTRGDFCIAHGVKLHLAQDTMGPPISCTAVFVRRTKMGWD